MLVTFFVEDRFNWMRSVERLVRCMVEGGQDWGQVPATPGAVAHRWFFASLHVCVTYSGYGMKTRVRLMQPSLSIKISTVDEQLRSVTC